MSRRASTSSSTASSTGPGTCALYRRGGGGLPDDSLSDPGRARRHPGGRVGSRSEDPMHDDDWLTARFEESRPRLHALAYRMLGSHAEADDAVQETWLRLRRNDPA